MTGAEQVSLFFSDLASFLLRVCSLSLFCLFLIVCFASRVFVRAVGADVSRAVSDGAAEGAPTRLVPAPDNRLLASGVHHAVPSRLTGESRCFQAARVFLFAFFSFFVFRRSRSAVSGRISITTVLCCAVLRVRFLV